MVIGKSNYYMYLTCVIRNAAVHLLPLSIFLSVFFSHFQFLLLSIITKVYLYRNTFQRKKIKEQITRSRRPFKGVRQYVNEYKTKRVIKKKGYLHVLYVPQGKIQPPSSRFRFLYNFGIFKIPSKMTNKIKMCRFQAENI